MENKTVSDDALGTQLFPQFAQLHSMVATEVAALTDQQLDWRSDRWEWSKWSIRRQVSHMPTFVFKWLLRQWGETLFLQGFLELGGLADYSLSPAGSQLDQSRYWAMAALLEKLDQAMQLARYVLSRETVKSLRQKELPRPDTSSHWRQFANAHPNGVRWDDIAPNFMYMTLEATFRHMYYEAITHLYNIQRLKRAQGLIGTIDIPFEGYWALPDWDRSEP